MRVAVVVVAFVMGCVKPRYAFEPRPVSAPPATEAERCYQDTRFELAAASGSFTSYTGGPYIVPSYTGTYIVSGTTTSHTVGESGVVLYRGGQRLDVRESIKQLRDPAVEHGYERVLAPTESAYRAYPKWRAAMVAITVLASGAVLGGAAWSTATGFQEDRALYLMLGGTAALLAAVPPIIGAYRTKDDHFLHERQLAFFHDRSFTPTLADSVRAANQRAAAACEHPTFDVPATARAREAIGATVAR